MAITLVITEHVGALPSERHAYYEGVRDRLERVAGAPVSSVQYEQVDDLRGADAVVLSGSFAPWADHTPEAIVRLGGVVRAYDGPVLGICAGMQLQALFAGGTVRHSASRAEKGFSSVDVLVPGGLLHGLPSTISVYEHHSDEVAELPEGLLVLARSETCAVEAIADPARRWWGTQFHPEAFDDAHPAGEQILRNFFELASHPPA